MASSAWHFRLGIPLNLTLPDLGHPDRPGLWEELRAKPIGNGILRCMGQCYVNDPNGPQWMYLRESNGRRTAVHHNRVAGERCDQKSESDEHKALKERLCRVAERAGFAAEAESRAADGKRVTDVLIRGADGLLLGCEVQLSPITGDVIRRRAQRAERDNILPFWTTDSLLVPLDHRAPWSRIHDAPWQRIVGGSDLLVRGGAQVAESERCGRRGPRCPVSLGRPCGRTHVYMVAARGLQLDMLAEGAASRSWDVLRLPKTRGGFNYWWLPAADLQRYRDDRSGVAPPIEPDDAVTAQPLDYSCRRNGAPEAPVRQWPPSTAQVVATAERFLQAAGEVRRRPPTGHVCRHWIGPEERYCGSAVGIRLYLPGLRCPVHTPSQIALKATVK